LNTEAIVPLVPNKLTKSLEVQVPDTAMLTIERWTNIPEIELFYPETFFKQVEKLSQTLEERNLNRYFDRLKSLNMLPSLMVMMSGSPGTGKTELCRQLARLHQRDLVLVNLSAIRSKWYGETEKCVERLFSAIRATQDAMDRMPLVLFNEADSFFISRGKGGPSSNVSNTENTLVTMFLEMLERCEGLFLATTNHTESMDPAFERRWAFKLTVPNPDDETKFLLLQKSLGGLVKETTLRHWSQHYQFTGAQLRNVQRKLLLYHESDLTSELLEEILNQELNGWKISKPLHRAQIEGFRAA
jgi:SpoVK/Ycf46/Vps4 family AAA+-type ATPase